MVECGFFEVVFCLIEIVGERFLMEFMFGLVISFRNWCVYVDRFFI